MSSFLSAPVSSQDKVTPLHVAAVSGHAEVAKVLLAAGANVHACANHPSTGDVSGEEGVGWITETGPLT